MEKQYLDLQGLEQFKNKIDTEIQEAVDSITIATINEETETLILG